MWCYLFSGARSKWIRHPRLLLSYAYYLRGAEAVLLFGQDGTHKIVNFLAKIGPLSKRL